MGWRATSSISSRSVAPVSSGRPVRARRYWPALDCALSAIHSGGRAPCAWTARASASRVIRRWPRRGWRSAFGWIHRCGSRSRVRGCCRWRTRRWLRETNWPSICMPTISANNGRARKSPGRPGRQRSACRWIWSPTRCECGPWRLVRQRFFTGRPHLTAGRSRVPSRWPSALCRCGCRRRKSLLRRMRGRSTWAWRSFCAKNWQGRTGPGR